MKVSFKKPVLMTVITLSTASVYYSQQVKDSLKNKEKEIETVVIRGVADIAKDRKTPVAVSTIKESHIVEKLGNQEFPEILNSTPSVYATKAGGGFGDSKVVIRGFTQENIAVMVNGMPVNDMESGRVFWSNWTGLSDVTSSMQVQRGLGSSKLAIASVGGTVNILTRSADKKQGGTVAVEVGNNDYHKALFAYNTGKSAKGWSSSFLMSRTAGSTYAQGTAFEGYNYYFALGYELPNKKHEFQFTITGAPQWHNQRNSYVSIANYIKYNPDHDGSPDRTYNPDWGYLNGEEYSFRRNYFHKPVLSLNWDWTMSSKSKLNTSVYASFGRGTGTANLGTSNSKSLSSFVDPTSGLVNFDAIYASNQASTPDKGIMIRNASVNSHNWYGIISNFNHKITDNLNFNIGIDGRYYYGYHYQLASDLLGGSAYKDTTNKNLYTPVYNASGQVTSYNTVGNYVRNTFDAVPDWNPFGGKINKLSDMIGYSNDGEVLWYGGFGQLEYTSDKFSAFVSGALSNQSFQRVDYFLVDGVSLLNGNLTTTSSQPTPLNPALHTKTGFKDILGYNVKAGANYNIDKHHNVFANIGYYSKQPIFSSVYPNQKNYLNPNLTNEKIFGIEAGYGFRSRIVNANINLYRTEWKDRFLRRGGLSIPDPTDPSITYLNAYSNIQGITEIHQGIEIDANSNINKYITINGMMSIGDFYYKGNATGNQFTETNEQIGTGTQTLYLDKVKVGGAAQFTAGGGVTIKPTEWVSVDGFYRGARNLYANLNLSNFQNDGSRNLGALKLPTYGLLDLGITFKVKLNDPKQYFTLRGNVYNVLDKTYIAESNTNIHSNMTLQQYADLNNLSATAPATATAYKAYQDAGTWNGVSQQNQVYYGFGRTWAATLSFNF